MATYPTASYALGPVHARPYRPPPGFLARCRATRERSILLRAECESLHRRVLATLARSRRLQAAAARDEAEPAAGDGESTPTRGDSAGA